ncbi:MAG: 4-hydroxy-3-methylbut-2-enyl diphosphate reductase [Erysipelothrix sp.]|nr:4-hydroxy-3-methylbut-2-enyl diphosphate reductase [Erysipelothrix sp.]
MEVVAIRPRGYCYGVVNALNVVKDAVKDHPQQKIYVLGIIIHNKFIKEALDRLGVISLYDNNKTKLELLDQINEGVVVFSAHGISQEVVDKAIEKGLIVYNATCRDVIKTQDIVKEYLDKNFDVLYIGKEKHPEAEAMLSINPKKIALVTNLNDIEKLDIKNNTIVTNQTTMSIYDTKDIMDAIRAKNPNVLVINEICNATKMRQEALLDLKDFDMVYVVGDHLSNNSNNLVKIAKTNVSKVQLIESVMDIKDIDLNNIKRIGVTAGASTPTSITQQVIDYLNKYPNTTAKDRVIDYSKLL